MHTPYITRHIALQEAHSACPLGCVAEHAYYLVLWWYSIPLGHLYVERGEQQEELLWARLRDACIPALVSYAKKAGQPADVAAWKGLDFPSLYQVMANLFSSLVPGQVPPLSDVSVVVCTRNRSRQLQRVLEGLQRQVCRPKEIIVVDNAPANNSTRRLVATFPEVRYLLEPRPGLDLARNTGAIAATCGVVAFTDDDVCLPGLWVFRLWEAFRDQAVQALTGLVLAEGQETESEQLFEKYWSFNRGYQDRVFGQNFIRMPAPKVWEIGAGANMAFRKSVLELVGYFDERLDAGAAGCSGDSELWFRILKAGIPIHYNPRVVVHHRHRQVRAELHQQLFHYMRGHVVAALIQHSQDRQAGYHRYIFKDLPAYYLSLLRAGLPVYGSRYQTLWSEIRGMAAGIRYYRKVRQKPACSFHPQKADVHECP